MVLYKLGDINGQFEGLVYVSQSLTIKSYILWTSIKIRIKIFAKALLYTCVGVSIYNKDVDKRGIDYRVQMLLVIDQVEKVKS